MCVQVLQERPHLALVIECMGLASLGSISSRQELMVRLGRCLELLITPSASGASDMATTATPLAQWLDKAQEEFNSLPEEGLMPLLSACSGNSMPDWLIEKAKSELGEAVSDLITVCLEC